MAQNPQLAQDTLTNAGIMTIEISGAGTHVLPVGLVPPGVKELRIHGSPSFSSEAIASVDHVSINDLNRDMSFPETLGKLFIISYSGKVPLPKVRNVFIHTSNKYKVDPGTEHWIYARLAKLRVESTDTYECVGSQESVQAFGETYIAIKLRPKAVSVPASAPRLNIKLSMPEGTLTRTHLGSIKELELVGSDVQFSADAISSLETLVVRDLNPNMSFPKTLKQLIIKDYSGHVSLPKVHNIFIHSCKSDLVTDMVPHYVFQYGRISPPIKDSQLFDYEGQRQTITACGDDYTVIKRVPKTRMISVTKPTEINWLDPKPIEIKTTDPKPIEAKTTDPKPAKERIILGIPKFDAVSIAGVESLVIKDLTEDLSFPPSLKRLVIRDYTGKVSLPKIEMVAVHGSDSNRIKERVEHYIMHYGSTPVPKLDTELFECQGEEQVIRICGETFNVLKRVPRVPVQVEPVVVAAPATRLEPMSKVIDILAAQQRILEAMIQPNA